MLLFSGKIFPVPLFGFCWLHVRSGASAFEAWDLDSILNLTIGIDCSGHTRRCRDEILVVGHSGLTLGEARPWRLAVSIVAREMFDPPDDQRVGGTVSMT